MVHGSALKRLDDAWQDVIWGRARLQSGLFRFCYTFDSGCRLGGTVGGDRLYNCPNLVFNLRALKATYCNSQGQALLRFETVFGQFNLDFPGALFSGSDPETGSFFSFNYRGVEATVYDGHSHQWVAAGWRPTDWTVEELCQTQWASIPARGRTALYSA